MPLEGKRLLEEDRGEGPSKGSTKRSRMTGKEQGTGYLLMVKENRRVNQEKLGVTEHQHALQWQSRDTGADSQKLQFEYENLPDKFIEDLKNHVDSAKSEFAYEIREIVSIVHRCKIFKEWDENLTLEAIHDLKTAAIRYHDSNSVARTIVESFDKLDQIWNRDRRQALIYEIEESSTNSNYNQDHRNFLERIRKFLINAAGIDRDISKENAIQALNAICDGYEKFPIYQQNNDEFKTYAKKQLIPKIQEIIKNIENTELTNQNTPLVTDLSQLSYSREDHQTFVLTDSSSKEGDTGQDHKRVARLVLQQIKYEGLKKLTDSLNRMLFNNRETYRNPEMSKKVSNLVEEAKKLQKQFYQGGEANIIIMEGIITGVKELPQLRNDNNKEVFLRIVSGIEQSGS